MGDRRPKVYVSGALNAAANIVKSKRFYLKVGEVCVEAGFDPYVPHTMGTDPIDNPEVTPEEVYRRDMEAVASSDLVVAYVGEPSLGVGAEVERAAARGIDVILLYEEGRPISRLTRGCPAVVATVTAEDARGLPEALRSVLRAWRVRSALGT